MSKLPTNFQRIVVATEPGDLDSVAVRYARAIAHWHNATLFILHLVDPVTYTFPDRLPGVLSDAARWELQSFEQEARRQGIETQSPVESATIFGQILQDLRDRHADLFILGTRAETIAGRIALGTAARRLISDSPCPILTVPPHVPVPAHGGWRHVLAATDFSPDSLSALETAHSTARSQFTVLSVMPAEAVGEGPTCIERLRFHAPLNESHTVPVQHFALTGRPADLIAQYATGLHVDLLVLAASQCELTAADPATGTMARIIAQVPCPVLCFPAAKPDAAQPQPLQEAALV